MKRPVYIVDAMNYIFRSYHALPRDIVAPSGMVANAIFGYARTLLRIVRDRKVDYAVSAFEGDSSFRNAIFAGYKANRAPPPEDLEPQLAYCRRISEAIGVPCFELAEYEADDIIGTVAMRMFEHGHSVVIVTGDKDMSQLVREGILVHDLGKQTWMDEKAVREKFGVAPSQIPDLLALTGDSVDNIPGVFGIGEKTARQILAVCSGVEDVAASTHLDSRFSFRGRVDILRRIRENIDSVRRSRKLATICCDVPLNVTPDTVRYRRANLDQLHSLCDELGFHQLIDEIPIPQPTLF